MELADQWIGLRGKLQDKSIFLVGNSMVSGFDFP